MTNPLHNELHAARDAFAGKAWADAYNGFAAAEKNAALNAADRERYAISAYLTGQDEISSELWALAHSEFLRDGNVRHAARCTFWLALDLFNRGEWARGNGWLARGLGLLEQDEAAPEHGLLLVLAARNYLKQRAVQPATEAATRACELAARSVDVDLSVFSKLAMAIVEAAHQRFARAAALFDETMVAVTTDQVCPVGVGVVYCAVIDACHSLFDLSRAREWTAALARWCSTQPDLVAFRGKCLVRRAEIMRISGAWPEALAEATHACSWSDGHTPSLKYPVGAAYYELAEIHRLRGDSRAAEDTYRRASEYAQSPEPGLALLHLQNGKLDVAQTSIRRVLAEQQEGLQRALVLHAAVDILIATGDVQGATTAADELAAMVRKYDGAAALRARAAHAAGTIRVANGDAQAALPILREAWMLWQDLEAPYDAARVRVLLGLSCQQLGDDVGAELEFDAARSVFRRLAAAPDLARVETLILMRHKVDARGLTARELQVVALIAKGKTNHAIAQELSISERTVDRHVSNILLKLELPSRSAATAYAYEHGLL